MPTALLIAAGIALAALAICALYAALGLTVRSCAICAKPVRERKAYPWTALDGATVFTHIGECSDEYSRRHFGNDYRAGEGP